MAWTLCPPGSGAGSWNTWTKACEAFFRRGGFPKSRSRKLRNGFTIASVVKVGNGRLRIPAFGAMRIRRRGDGPYPDGGPVPAVIKRGQGKRYAIVRCRVDAIEEDSGRAIGVDMNVRQVADGDGGIHHLPGMQRLEAGRRRLRRTVSRRRRRSNSRRKARAGLARRHGKIAGKRKNWQHRVTGQPVDRTSPAVVGNLDAKGMTESSRGPSGNPGKNFGRKAGLNPEILNAGWSELNRMLDYRAVRVPAVNPAHTSRTCHECGTADSRSRRSRVGFVCVECGYAANADINAAKNMLAFGIGAPARGGDDVGRPVKRENGISRAA